MQALVLTAYNRLEIQDFPTPEIADDEVLLRVAACGVCGSDIHGMDGSTGRRQPPLIMGHEASGTIAAVGRAVHDWAAGDRVTFDSTIYCGRCWHCRRGEINLCDQRRVLGVSCDDYRRHGAFAEFVAVPQHVLYRLPDAVSFPHAAMVEPLSVALHAIARTPLKLGDTAVVIGAGMIGLLVVQALRTAGCGRIYAVDIYDRRLEMARQLGADEGFRSDLADLKAEVFERTGGRGADIALEVVGATATVGLAVASLRKGGNLTLVGNLAPKVEFPLQAVVTREIGVSGSCASRGEYPACLDAIARGRIKVAPLISAVAPLCEGPNWFARLQRGGEGLLKVILQPQKQAGMDLKGKNALVTGGGSGIGLGIALALAGEGCQVAICGRNQAKLEDAVDQFEGEPDIATRPCDISDRKQVALLVESFHASLGPIDILVNAAGINVVRRTMAQLDPDDFDRILAVNTTGLFNVLHAVLPDMRARRQGTIFNISSVAGKRALPVAGPAYAASKFAATALGTAIGLEERANGIRITNIYPGEVDTPLLDLRPVAVSAEKKATMVHPEDIAACVIAIARLPQHVVVPELVITPAYQEYM